MYNLVIFIPNFHNVDFIDFVLVILRAHLTKALDDISTLLK